MKKIVFVWFAGFLFAGPIPDVHAGEDQIVIEDLSLAQLRAEIDKIQHQSTGFSMPTMTNWLSSAINICPPVQILERKPVSRNL